MLGQATPTVSVENSWLRLSLCGLHPPLTSKINSQSNAEKTSECQNKTSHGKGSEIAHELDELPHNFGRDFGATAL